MNHPAQMADELFFFFLGPLLAVTRLHQQRHHATRHHQLGQDPSRFATLRGPNLLPPAGQFRGDAFRFSHGQRIAASELRTSCQPRQTKNPRFAKRQACFGRTTTIAATAAPIASG